MEELKGNNQRLGARVYYAGRDFPGVAYHACYSEFLERSSMEYLRLVGEQHSEDARTRANSRLAWIVRCLQIDFQRRAWIDKLIIVETKTTNISGARVEKAHTIRRGGDVLIEAQRE